MSNKGDEEKELQKLYDRRKKDKAQLKSKRLAQLEKNPPNFHEVSQKIFAHHPLLQQKIQEHQVIFAWSEIVGSPVNQISRALRFRNQTLYVYVQDSLWLQQLVFLKYEILQKLRGRFRGLSIRDIFFTQHPSFTTQE